MKTVSRFLINLKPWMLPIAMVIGVIFHNQIHYIEFLSKYLIFIMLLITYSRVSIKNFRLDGSMMWLLVIQILGASAVYISLLGWNRIIAEGVAICVFCSTATAAPVITGILGGSVEKVAVYSLLSNVSVAFIAPIVFAIVGDNAEMSFMQSVISIAENVFLLLIGPLIVALLLKRFSPRVSDGIAHHQGLSYYIWAFSLIIVVGSAVSFVMKEPLSEWPMLAAIAALSLVVCLIQFYLGHKIGARYGDTIAGAQSLGQKNTVLAIWMALTYLSPLSSVGPAFYIAWHNTVNSVQIARHARAEKHRG